MAPTASIDVDLASEQRLSDDKVFHLLQNRRRRAVIRYLRGTDETVSMRDIAEQVAAWEHDTSVAALDSDERQRVYIPLYQNHLPKLDDEGVIEYDQSRGTVKRTPVADQLERYLTLEDDESATAPPSEPAADETADEAVDGGDDWIDAYLGATGVTSGFFLAAVFNVPVVSALPNILLASLMLVTFATVTFAHTVFGATSEIPLPF
ncbi:DUF7344 domain-containing protein [Halobacterium yunchengense]|uniref:DUF7344 domain-containing protein n=1 Tax=Halobacterium yunchengense TaxID=3108497 RepID=UPI003009B507